MQPLKRFTQCGSLTMLFGVFIILFGVSSTALTTFGKSNLPPPPTPGPIIKGRECLAHEDCAAIEKSSCVRDPDDYKMRCLCGNDSPPNNGLCPDTLKGLRHKCNSSNECEDGLICTYENTNRTIGVAKFMSSKAKMCLCDNENGYWEDVHHDICSGATVQALSDMLISILTSVIPLLVYSCLKNHF
ncbi:oogenesis-related protein sosie [Haematobia irritans]|uniref:oogenesis-related protein sosie n=1 Tax=Haematobia irritans TaxID=7368 RepID=UPI003F50C55C